MRVLQCVALNLEQYGTALFHRVCKMDLEGVVAKLSFGPYTTDRERTTWFRIKNPKYSQMEGREELFRRERHNEPAPGWAFLRISLRGIGVTEMAECLWTTVALFTAMAPVPWANRK
jgi:hypothetical protein